MFPHELRVPSGMARKRLEDEHMTALLTGTGTNKHSQLQVQIDIRVDASGQVAGTIAAGSAIPVGSGTAV